MFADNVTSKKSDDTDEIFGIYKKRLMEDIGLSKLSDEEKGKAEEKIESLVNTRIINLIMIYLPEEKAEELSKLLDQDDQEKTMEYVFKNIPSFEDKILAELTKIREELIEKIIGQPKDK